MDKKQQVLSFIRQKGPSIPGWVNKEIGLDILMTSALMSEMVFDGSIKVSSVKIGGSPLYYIQGQESALVNYLDKLHEKEKRAVLLLKEKLVLRDKISDALVRVALRQAKDFAKPFSVNINGEKELFWKWFLLNDSELIKKRVYALIGDDLKKKQPAVDNGKEKESSNTGRRTDSPLERRQKESSKPQVKKNVEKEPTRQEKLNLESKQENVQKDINLSGNLKEEFQKLRIQVISQEVVRKGKEFDMVITLPSAVGRLKYFCKYIDKKKVNDKDISSAFVKGQMEKLPVLVLVTGELNKKAEKMAEEMKGITIKKVGV